MSDSLNDIIQNLSDSHADIESAYLFTVDGLILSVNQRDTLIDEIGATAAAIKSIAERSSHLLYRGEMQQVHIFSKQGSLIMTGVKDDMILVALIREQANIGMIFHEIKTSAQKISHLFS